MLARGRIEKRGELNWVCWEFNSLVVDMLVDPAMYARLNLKIATNIESYVGTALYEICARYRNNPSGVTSRKSTDWWIDSLSQTAAEPGKRREWRKFKDEKLLNAIEDINDTSDLTIQLIEEKVGRAIAFVQFKVAKKAVEALPEVRAVNVTMTAEIEKLASALDIDLPRVETLIKRYGESVVRMKLRLLQARINDKSLPPIERKVGYLRYLLEDPQDDAVKDATTSVRPTVVPATEKSTVPAVNAELATLSRGVTSAELTPTPAQPSLRTKIRDEFNILPESERKEIIGIVAKQLKAENRFGALEMKNSHLTYIRPGLFGSAVTEYYGRQLYGEKWPAPVSSF
jgi:hypothetical protein